MTTGVDLLAARLDEAAECPRLLVACDYDGTLSDIVADPDTARPRPLASRALASLAGLPDTMVAIVSGRSLDDLRRVAGELRASAAVRLFGSHGLEGDDGLTVGIARSVARDRDDLVRRLRSITTGVPGARLEPKPYGGAIHYRGLHPMQRAIVVRASQALLSDRPELFFKPGKDVIELSVLPLYKPFAIDTLQHRWVPDITIYAGDDQTDEDVFTTLWPGDIGIKVGDGATSADYRAADTGAFEQLLCRLGRHRARLRNRAPSAIAPRAQ